MAGFEDRLVAAVRGRQAGQSVLDAFRGLLVAESRQLAAPGGTKGPLLGAKLIMGSASLRRREIEIVAEHAETLAGLLADEMGASERDVRPFVIANALMGLHRALVELVRRLATEGAVGAEIASQVVEQAERGLLALSNGLADYGRRES